MTILARLGFVFCLSSSALSGVAQDTTSPQPARPVEPIGAILDAFQSHDIVALGEGAHGNEPGHAFRLSLIRESRFAERVNDIVVENGSARYQGVIDRFIDGEDVAYESLRRVWEDTTQVQTTERTITLPFFQAVRDVNRSRAKGRRLRVLLGDPPIDWTSVATREEHRKWIEQRDIFPADLIQQQVLAKKRRALVIYGDMHLQRKNLGANYETAGLAQTVVSRLENTYRARVFTIKTELAVDLSTLQPDVASWPAPRLALVRNTTLGAADFTAYYPSGGGRFSVVDEKLAPVPREQWRSLRMEDQFDAVLYLGPPSSITFAPPLPALCADTAYMKMRLDRIALTGPPPEATRLKQYCASLAPQ